MDMIKDALEKDGFAYTIKEHKDTAYDGLFILQKGYATLFVEEAGQKKSPDNCKTHQEPTLCGIFKRLIPADLVVDTQYIAFVGAGGKTSLIEYLARETAKRNKKTVITTTTKIYAREPYMLLTQNRGSNDAADNPIRAGKTIENSKLTAVTFDDIRELGKTFDIVLIEADGAKGKPLKYPAPHEPVIPPFSGMVFVLAGLDGLFGQIKEEVFRWDILREKVETHRQRDYFTGNIQSFFYR